MPRPSARRRGIGSEGSKGGDGHKGSKGGAAPPPLPTVLPNVLPTVAKGGAAREVGEDLGRHVGHGAGHASRRPAARARRLPPRQPKVRNVRHLRAPAVSRAVPHTLRVGGSDTLRVRLVHCREVSYTLRGGTRHAAGCRAHYGGGEHTMPRSRRMFCGFRSRCVTWTPPPKPPTRARHPRSPRTGASLSRARHGRKRKLAISRARRRWREGRGGRACLVGVEVGHALDDVRRDRQALPRAREGRDASG